MNANVVDSGAGWRVVAGCFVGLLFSVGTVVVYSFGLVAPAIADERGWTVREIGGALGAFSLATVIAAPIYGRLIDRQGERRVIFMSAVALALTLMALAWLPLSLWQTYAAFALLGLAGGGTLPSGFARIVVGWFQRRRGLALGTAMTGVGVGAALMPLLLSPVIADYGWRSGLMVLSAGILIVALPVMWALLRPGPLTTGAALQGTGDALGGFLRTPAFIILAVFALLSGALLIAAIGNFVPLLTERGVASADAARFQALVGVSVIVARLVIGHAFDRLSAPLVMAVVFATTGVTLSSLTQFDGTPFYVAAAIGIGIAVGAEMDVLAFLVGRYFPPTHFARLFGLLFAAYSLGGFLGPTIFALFPGVPMWPVLAVLAFIAAANIGVLALEGATPSGATQLRVATGPVRSPPGDK
jgi:MFS family permease